MSIETDTRDRVIRLESVVEAQAKTIDEMNAKVTEMHELLLTAKGAKYIIVGSAALAGFVAAKLGALLPWLQNLPK